MATACPQCGILLTSSEAKRGACPSCSGNLPVSKASSTSRTPSIQQTAVPVGGSGGRCELSGEIGSNVQTRYITATTFSPLGLIFPIIMLLTRKQVCVAVRCSDESYRKVRSVLMKPIWLLLALFFLGAPLAIVGMAVIGSKVPMLAAMIGLGWLACLPGMMIWMRRYRRRELDALLSGSLNDKLQDQMKGRRWGMTTMLTAGKKAPRGLTVVSAYSL